MTDERPAPPSNEEAVDMMARAVASGADFAGWLADILARTAARLGSSEALLAARPGSWEAGHVRGLIAGVVGEGDEFLGDYGDRNETGEGNDG